MNANDSVQSPKKVAIRARPWGRIFIGAVTFGVPASLMCLIVGYLAVSNQLIYFADSPAEFVRFQNYRYFGPIGIVVGALLSFWSLRVIWFGLTRTVSLEETPDGFRVANHTDAPWKLAPLHVTGPFDIEWRRDSQIVIKTAKGKAHLWRTLLDKNVDVDAWLDCQQKRLAAKGP
jgi:hypothetical protein